MRTALLLIALLAGNVFGQIDLKVVKYQAVTGLKNPVIVGTTVFVEGLDSVVSTKPVALIVAKSESASEIRVEASDQQRQTVALEKIDGGYLLSAPGKTWVEVKEYIEFEIGGVKRKLLSDSKIVTVELGPPPPPPPPPTPPVPPDQFGNLGQKVAALSAGLPKRKELAAIYSAGASRAKNDVKATVDMITGDIIAQRSTVLGADYAAYSKLIDTINADIKSRWSVINKQTLSEYCTAIALGLEAQ